MTRWQRIGEIRLYLSLRLADFVSGPSFIIQNSPRLKCDYNFQQPADDGGATAERTVSESVVRTRTYNPQCFHPSILPHRTAHVPRRPRFRLSPPLARQSAASLLLHPSSRERQGFERNSTFEEVDDQMSMYTHVVAIVGEMQRFL